MKRPAFATLALALLALLFGWETRQALRTTPGGRDNAATSGVWQPGVSAPDPQPPADPGPAAAAVAARPLFRPDRQPFREQSAGASARNYEAEMSRFSLIGVLGFGNAPVGVVVGKAGNKGERWEVRRGDSLQGFKVKEVGIDGLRLTADGREFLLPLYAGPPAAAGGAVRTDATRRDAGQSKTAPHAGPPPSGPSLPVTAAPPASPLASRLRRFPTAPAAPGVLPVPSPAGASPAPAPRFIPGR